jgi:DNA repair protein RadA/Sms
MYICSNCQKTFQKWQGQCDGCNQWNTLVENQNVMSGSTRGSKGSARGGSALGRKSGMAQRENIKPVRLNELSHELLTTNYQLKTQISEFDNAIGGHLIPGQVILFSGEPGVGKSTLTLQIIENLSNQGQRILYICGEESPLQIKQRSDRLGLTLKNVLFLSETNVRSIENYVASQSKNIDFLVIDSIQTMYEPSVLSTSGSVSQVSESTNIITNLSKGFNITTMIIGHVTKSGDIAGPKILEHMVDTVLYFEGDKRYEFRLLRVEKNRFGPSDEVGIFKMTQKGLIEVKDTKELFNSAKEEASGSVYALILEGSRPVVVEVQALATKSYFSNPRRTTSGFDLNRLFIILAIIDKKLKIHTGEFDVYVNITGGIRITDPGLDLAVIQAIISSIKDKKMPKENVYFGEVGLTGEIRKVFLEDKRVKEAKRLGFKNIFSSREYRNVGEI